MKVGKIMHQSRLAKYRKLQQSSARNDCSRKILNQLGFLLELSAAQEERFDDTILPQIERLFDASKSDGAITVTSSKQVEGDLSLLSTEAKKKRVVCFVQPDFEHKDICDPAYIINEVRHALALLERFKKVAYFEPRTAVYRLLETHQPLLLAKVKNMVELGRWEVGLTSWNGIFPEIVSDETTLYNLVENKKYLTSLLGLKEDDIKIHFELEGFSSNNELLEMLTDLGVKLDYYYGCESQDFFPLYSRDKKELFCIKGKDQKDIGTENELALFLSEFFSNMQNDILLRVVTLNSENCHDTEETISNLSDMSSWQLFPEIEFLGLEESFYEIIEGYSQELLSVGKPERFSDLRFYKTRKNLLTALLEQKNIDARILDAQASMISGDYNTQFSFSSIKKSRLDFYTSEDSIKLATQVNAEHAMNLICLEMNTTGINYGSDKNTGFEHSNFAVQQHERGHLPVQDTSAEPPFLFTVFNTTAYPRSKVIEVDIKNWCYSTELLKVVDSNGKSLPCQIEKNDGNGNIRVGFLTTLPEFGYMTYRIFPEKDFHLEPFYKEKKVVYKGGERILLENKYLRALFSVKDMSLISLRVKESNRELVDTENGTAMFSIMLQEDNEINTHRMSPAMTKNLNRNYPVYIKDYFFGAVKGWVEYEIAFESCILNTKVMLEQESKNLKWETSVKWIPESIQPEGNWKLVFELDYKFVATDIRYGTSWRVIDNPTNDQILMSAHTIVPIPVTSDDAVIVMAKGHRSFHHVPNKIMVNLLENRNQKQPDKSGDKYSFDIGVGVGKTEPTKILKQAAEFLTPIYIIENSIHEGVLPAGAALMIAQGDAVLTYVENLENSMGMLLRFYNPTSDVIDLSLNFVRNIDAAYIIDYYGNQLGSLHLSERDFVSFNIDAKRSCTVKILFE